jgi:hypothetical protein
MLPELGQWAVTQSPVVNFTSTMNRWYLLTRRPPTRGGHFSPFDVVGALMPLYLSKPATKINENLNHYSIKVDKVLIKFHARFRY